MEHYKFFQNRQCEYFPCHMGVKADNFNCLFCCCPLYPLGEQCGGNFIYTENGIKDCSNCTKPHCRDNYDLVMEQLGAVIELVKKKGR